MNKTELIDAIAAESGLSKTDSRKALDCMVSVVAKSLKGDDNVILTGFGTFGTAVRAARTARNPKTGSPVEVKAKKAVVFKAGSELSASVL